MKDKISDYGKNSDHDFLIISLLLSINFAILYIPRIFQGLIENYIIYNVSACLMAAATCMIVFLCHRGTSPGRIEFSKGILFLFSGMSVFFIYQLDIAISLLFSAMIAGVLLVMYRGRADAGSAVSRGWIAAVVCVAGLIMVGASGYEMIERIQRVPIDPYRGDMIPQVIMGLDLVFSGQNPYVQINRPDFVPWPLYFGYGPGLWVPYIIPYALNIDLRLLAILCASAVPFTLVFAATCFFYHFRVIRGLCLLLLSASIACHAYLFSFTEIGHTQIYWPIIILFCYFLSRDRIKTASFLLGLLVLSRTSMIFLIPVFTIYLWKFHRERFLQCLLMFSATVLIAMAPFIIADVNTLYYNIYTKYLVVVKKTVWTRDWIFTTFGTTSFLVKNQYTEFIGPVQYLISAGVWITSYFSMREKKYVLIWMSASLMVFSMTCIWPAYYIFFDAMILFVFSVLFQFEWARPPLSKKFIALFSLGIFLFFASISGLFIYKSENTTMIDIGDKSARKHLYRGFYNGEREKGSEKVFCWAGNDRTSVIFTRRSGAAAGVKMICMPFSPADREKQTISIIVNGRALVEKSLASGWQEISFVVPPGVLRTGVNMMVMKFSYSLSPREMGLSDDERKLSAAFDKIVIEPLDS